MAFTKEQINEIARALSAQAKKDSEFDVALTVDENSQMPFVQLPAPETDGVRRNMIIPFDKGISETKSFRDLRGLVEGLAGKDLTEVWAVLTKMIVAGAQINVTQTPEGQLVITAPLVTETSAGTMTSEAYNQLIELLNRVSNLENMGGKFIEAFATKADLNAYVFPSTVNNGDWAIVLDDEDYDGARTEYIVTNGDGPKRFEFAGISAYDPVGIATTTKTGVVLSSETVGKVFVEANGVMSVVGWDELKDTLNSIGAGFSIVRTWSAPSNPKKIYVTLSGAPTSSVQPSQFRVYNPHNNEYYVVSSVDTISDREFVVNMSNNVYEYGITFYN